MAGGSYNRFLLLYVERSKILPEGGGADERLVQQLATELRQRLLQASAVRNLRRRGDAATYWADLYHEFIELEDDEALGPWVARAVPYTLRLAGLYAALHGTAEIRIVDLASAAALVRYSLDSVRYFMQTGSSHDDLERIARAIRGAGPDGVNKSSLTKAFGTHRTAAELDAVLGQLLELEGFEVAQLASTGGRPATKYRFVA